MSIIELENNNVKFSYGGNSTIKSVKILDVLGRTIYRLRGNKKTEIYNLSSLSSSVYIAQIELSNGTLISKKAIKK
ncbi:T9SS type A sorting domain-containing protein [Lacinutrix sp.]|uniref:T9SS type A sorting domain-containing protein n=1 Tax=Lacinutrix sp. TaxID=1937692 RepID=UPI0026095412|nr:T9SS type A sorting domain-containing protein [Lacinutrix sp.]MDG1714337.1 T9SS type A sorting domain-containing protein [Lacinutrix sp.]